MVFQEKVEDNNDRADDTNAKATPYLHIRYVDIPWQSNLTSSSHLHHYQTREIINIRWHRIYKVHKFKQSPTSRPVNRTEVKSAFGIVTHTHSLSPPSIFQQSFWPPVHLFRSPTWTNGIERVGMFVDPNHQLYDLPRGKDLATLLNSVMEDLRLLFAQVFQLAQ